MHATSLPPSLWFLHLGRLIHIVLSPYPLIKVPTIGRHGFWMMAKRSRPPVPSENRPFPARYQPQSPLVLQIPSSRATATTRWPSAGTRLIASRIRPDVYPVGHFAVSAHLVGYDDSWVKRWQLQHLHGARLPTAALSPSRIRAGGHISRQAACPRRERGENAAEARARLHGPWRFRRTRRRPGHLFFEYVLWPSNRLGELVCLSSSLCRICGLGCPG